MEENQVKVPEGWENVKFNDFVFFQEGPGLMASLFKENGFPFMNIRCIENGKIVKDSCQFISNDIANNQYKHFQLEEKDIIVSTSGTLGKKAFVNKEDLPLLLNTSIIRFKPKNEDLNRLFLYYILESHSFLYDLYSQSTGSAQINVGPSHLKKVNIVIPQSTTEQQKIAEILSKVDTAIEQTESLIAKYQRIKTGLMQDLLTKGIDKHGNIRSEETHEFKDSELGRIPKDWDCKELSYFSNLKSGGTPSRTRLDYWDGRIPWVKTAEVDYTNINKTEEYITEKGLKNSSAFIVPENTVLMALYGQGKTRGRVAILDIPASTNQACTAFLNLENIKLYLFYFILTKEYLRLRDLSNDGAQKNLSNNLLSSFKIAYPINDNEQELVESSLLSIDKKLHKELIQISKFKRIKTALMQDLLSGKKRVTSLLTEID